MKRNIIGLMFIFVLTFLPALSNEEVIKSLVTEEKLPQLGTYGKLNVNQYRKYIREKENF